MCFFFILIGADALQITLGKYLANIKLMSFCFSVKRFGKSEATCVMSIAPMMRKIQHFSSHVVITMGSAERLFDDLIGDLKQALAKIK